MAKQNILNDSTTWGAEATKIEANFDELYNNKVDNSRVLTDVPENAKFTDTIVDISGKADKSQVLTNVPANAKFTDTTYEEITEAEINTGTASDLRTITARRVTFILGKVQTLINNAVGALTKSDVGLGSVDNVQQASKTEFDTHNNDAVRHITAQERTAWNAKGSSNLVLGETSATAYRGDRGQVAYDHSQSAHAPSNAQKNSDITKSEIEAKLTGAITSHTHSAYVPTSRTVAGKALTGDITLAKGDVGLGNVDNTSDANKPVSTAQQTALNAKIDASKFQVVTELPASPVTGVFYFVKE